MADDQDPFAKYLQAGGPPAGAGPDPNDPFAKYAPTKLPDIGQGRAAFEGVLGGASANFRDEILAASEASGLPHWMGGLRAPVGAVRLAMESKSEPTLSGLATGQEPVKGPVATKFDEALANIRAKIKAAKEQYPATYLAGEVGGAIATPVPSKILAAPTMAQRAGRAGVYGGAYGGLSGVGAGESPEERVTGGTLGTVIGGGVGMAATPVVEGATQLIGPPVRKIYESYKGMTDPEAAAAAIAGRTIKQGAETDPGAVSRLTPQEFDRLKAADIAAGREPTVRNIDLGGGKTRATADASAVIAPEAREVYDIPIDKRFAGQGPRVINWLKDNFTHTDPAAMQEANKQASRFVNRPAYKEAYRQGDMEIASDELRRLLDAPYVQGALGEAISKWKNFAIHDGYGALNPTFDIVNGEVVRSGTGIKAFPNLQLWDYAARALQDKARSMPGTQEGMVYNGLARAVKNELDNAVPAYKTAREGALGFFQADNAIEAGQKFVDLKRGNDEARRAFTNLPAEQKNLFRDSFIGEFIDRIKEVGDERTILNNIAQSQGARERLEIVLGPQKAKELEVMLRVEGILDLPRNVIQGNSRTVQRAVAAHAFTGGQVAGGVIGSTGVHDLDPKTVGVGALVTAISTGGKRIDARVAQKVAELLMSNEPSRLLAGATIIAKSEKLFENLRSFDRKIAATGGQQTGGMVPRTAPLVQGPARADAHAEDD